MKKNMILLALPTLLVLLNASSNTAYGATSEKNIYVNGKFVTTAQGLASSNTTFMPMTSVTKMLDSAHVPNVWDGENLDIGKGIAIKKPAKNGTMNIFSATTASLNIPLIVSNNQPYVPIWYIMQALKSVGIENDWNGTDWTLISERGSVKEKIEVSHKTLYTYYVEGNRDVPAFSPMAADVGYNGIAPVGTKREGDGKTPAGTYSFGFAFGYYPKIETQMPYREATNSDYWVDDPKSPQYNEWVHGTPNASSYEHMRRSDDLYEFGAVINYNTKRTPYLGSAIFLHEWRSAGASTDGCIAVSRPNIQKLLAWLDPSKDPTVTIQ